MFDDNIFNHICLHINDAKTYLNFTLACKKTYKISKLHTVTKMNDFISETRTIDENDGGDCYFYIERKLPNGNLHGEYYESCSYSAYGDHLRYYFNGILLSKVIFDEPMCYFITHYSCKCVADNNMINFKQYVYQNFDLNKFTLSSTSKHKKYCCKICNTGYKYTENWEDREHIKWLISQYNNNDVQIVEV